MERPQYTMKEASAIISEREPDQLLAAVASSGGFEITVVVGGQIYSGSAVKHEKWLEASERIGVPNDVLQQLNRLHKEPVRLTEDTPLLEDDGRPEHEIAEEQIKTIQPYLYLVDFRQVLAGESHHHRGAAMRIRLSEVQGWSFGRLD